MSSTPIQIRTESSISLSEPHRGYLLACDCVPCFAGYLSVGGACNV